VGIAHNFTAADKSGIKVSSPKRLGENVAETAQLDVLDTHRSNKNIFFPVERPHSTLW